MKVDMEALMKRANDMLKVCRSYGIPDAGAGVTIEAKQVLAILARLEAAEAVVETARGVFASNVVFFGIADLEAKLDAYYRTTTSEEGESRHA